MERHSGAAVRGVAPGVDRLHRERPFGGSHDEALVGNDLRHLVGVDEAAPYELGDERDLRTDCDRLRRLPLDRLDVYVSARRIVRIGTVGGDLASGTVDLDLRLDVDGHRWILDR